MSGKLERSYPYLFAAIAVCVYFLFFRTHSIPKTAANVLGAVVSLAGIALGFLAAIQSIFVAIDDRPIIDDLKDVGTYDLLISYLHHAMCWSFVLALLSVAGLIADFENDTWGPFAVSSWLFSLICSGLCSYRIFTVFQRVLQSRRRR